MADRKSGPVKPPVLELKARQAQGRSGGAKSAEKAEAPRAEGTAAATTPAGRAAGSNGTARSAGAGEKAAPAPSVASSAKPVDDPAAETAKSAGATASPRPGDPGDVPSEPPRDDDRPRAADAPGAATQRPAAALPPRPPARLAMPWSAISIAAIVGAILGTLLTYAAVNLLPLPNTGPSFADPTQRLDAEAKSLDDLTARVTDLEGQTRKTQVSLDATIAQLDSGIAELRQSISAIPKPQAVDLGPIEQQMKTLEDRIAAIGAGASSADAEALATNISELQSGLADLKAGVARLDQRVGSTNSTVAALGTELDAAKQAITAQNQTLGGAEVSPAVRLPLVVSGLESAFDNGRPYQDELTSLTTLLPDLSVPSAVAQSAKTGLPRPDLVGQRFTAAMPAILAGRTATGSGDWSQDAVEWIKALLALRPAGEEEGNSPDAVVSRLEAAVNRRDFAAAADLLDALPAPMRTAAGDVGMDIHQLATADAFLAGLRAQALAPAADTGAAATGAGQ